jgi:DNA-binding transcriptional MerR regulator
MYRIDALMSEGFTRREIRRFVERGILPHANGRGANAYYDESHLVILRGIRNSRESHRTLKDIAEEIRLTHPALFRRERRLARAADRPPNGPRTRRTVYAVPGS